MIKNIIYSLLTFSYTLVVSTADNSILLRSVTVKDFSVFVEATAYITDAEKFGWSIVQKDVFNFEVVNNATWRIPNGVDTAQNHFPVTQVSYNDAAAYATWANVLLPNYEQYWELVKTDKGKINENTMAILPVSEDLNIVGNVWDITLPDSLERVRLAGGSYLCSPETCDGTNKNRELYVDIYTGNSHIGFAVFRK